MTQPVTFAASAQLNAAPLRAILLASPTLVMAALGCWFGAVPRRRVPPIAPYGTAPRDDGAAGAGELRGTRGTRRMQGDQK